MYQAVYPWLVTDQFTLQIPRTMNNSFWNDGMQKMVDVLRAEKPDRVTFVDKGRHANLLCEYGEDDNIAPGPTIQSASEKLLNFIRKRDVHVVFHPPNTCTDKKPWSKYEHFHLTFVSKYRPGVDTVWANVVAQHKALAKGCQIPFTQITMFPGSWANYLTQRPRITWRVPICQVMEVFSLWVFEEHVEREEVPATHSQVDNATPGQSKDTETNFQLPCGKSMNLYKYVKWLITTFGHSNRESLIEGALSTADTSTFERALTHPMFDSVCNKAFAVDKSLEAMQGFKAHFEKIQWDKFEGNHVYLDVDVSIRLFRHLLTHHECNVIRR